MKKGDKNTHFSTNYLVLFGTKGITTKKALINARDEKNAIKKAIGRLCRMYPEEVITYARIGGTYDNKHERIEI